VAKVQVVQLNGTSWHKLAQVEHVEQVEAGLQIYVEQVEQVEQEQGGLQIDVEQVEQEQGVCPAEPLHLTQSGTTRPWKFVPEKDQPIFPLLVRSLLVLDFDLSILGTTDFFTTILFHRFWNLVSFDFNVSYSSC